MIKYNILNIFFILLLFIGCNSKKTDKKNIKINEHPLFIESLRKKIFSPQDLNIDKKVKSTKTYDSYTAYYYSDGLKQYTLLNIPKSSKHNKKFPVVIVNHGYIPPEKYSTVDSYKYISSFFANNGFIVLKPDYRGHDKSETDDNALLDRLKYSVDVLNLLYSVQSIKNADTNNIFMFGHSMGGGITLTVLTVADNIKAATLWAPVSVEFPESTLYFVRKRSASMADGLLMQWKNIFKGKDDFKKLSSVNYLDYIKCPVLLQHGKKDESVPYEWSVQLEQKLIENNIDYKFNTYDNEDHNFAKGSFYKVLNKDLEFFKKYMD